MGNRDKGKKEVKKPKKDNKKVSIITSQPSLSPVQTVDKKKKEREDLS